MQLDEFTRSHAIRAPQLMWFLGAGTSAMANVPTANQMIWDFKRQLFCTRRGMPISAIPDLADQTTQSKLQAYFDMNDQFPPAGSDSEYAAFFEAAYPSLFDRRNYLAQIVAQGSPSYGHIVLAALLKLGKARVIWTTNFDKVVEDACHDVLGSSTLLTVASLGEPSLALEALNQPNQLLLAKIHGDFHSVRLKNTTAELREQNSEMASALLEGCRRHGLAVIGYSGRDESVMDVLRLALDQSGSFPNGLYWFHRLGSLPSHSVQELIADAQSRGKEAALIEVQSFDELMAALYRGLPSVPLEVSDLLDSHRPRRTAAPTVQTSVGSWPVLRTNAIPFRSFPQTCRLIQCNIGGLREVKDAIETSGANIVASRRQQGIIAFGSDDEIRTAFESFGITSLDSFPISINRLRYDSMEKNLVMSALLKALTREKPVVQKIRRGEQLVVVDIARLHDAALTGLREACPDKRLSGHVTLGSQSYAWSEAASIGVEFANGALWLIVEPTVWVDTNGYTAQVRADAASFVSNRISRRYNQIWNNLMDSWVKLLRQEADGVLSSFAISDGIDATFTLESATGFSWRQRR